MMRQLRQKCVQQTGGDCFRTAVAMVLDLDPDTMPNFCWDAEPWWPAFQKWLDENYGLMAVDIKLATDEPTLMSLTPGVPIVLTGPSPSGPWLHSIAGMTAEDGFEMLYDPNPCDKMLPGVTNVTFFVPLRPDHHARKCHGHLAASV